MNLDTIKQNAKRDRKPVDAWGGKLYIRTLSAADYDKVLAANGNDATRVELIALAATDEAGARVFDSEEGRAFLASEDADGATVHRLFNVACEHNRLNEDHVKN
jgi:hypothetical protein